MPEQKQKLKEIFAKNLDHYLTKKGINQTDMAKDLGFPEMTVSNWINANTYPRPDKIQIMADYFGIKRSDLTEEKPENIIEIGPEIVRIPIIGTIACGDPITATQNIEGYFNEFAEMLPSGNLFMLIAKGDSMEPTIPNGSKVLVREQKDVESGEIAAVQVNGDTEATLKRIKKQGNVIYLIPDNPKHDTIIIDESNPGRIIGKAVRVTKDLTKLNY